MSMDNGLSWIPSPGVVPVIRRCGGERMNNVRQWIAKRMLSSPQSEAEEDKMTALACVFELGRLVVESGAAEQVEVWSEKGYLPLKDVLLLGASAGAVHRWALTRNMFAEAEAAVTIWLEEPMDDVKRQALLDLFGHSDSAGEMPLPGGGGGATVAVADFGRVVGLEEFQWLDRLAKSCGVALLVDAESWDVRGHPMDATSYATLAMQVALERGIDLSHCAGTVAVVDELTDDGSGWRGRILRAEDDGTPIPVVWTGSVGKDRLFGRGGR